MNKNEKELFLALCAYKAPKYDVIEALLKEGAATPSVLGYLFANRMSAVAYGVLKQGGLLCMTDREFRNSLRNAALLAERLNEDHLGCVKFVSAQLEACGIPYALLKGAYLCYAYPCGYRTSNDIDILISPEDVGKVSARLKLAGFNQGYLREGKFIPATRAQIIESKMMRGETVPFIKEVKLPFMKYIEADLNFSLDFKNSDDEILKKMLSRTRMISVADTEIRSLDRYDFLLHLCAHLYKEAATMPWIRLGRDMTFYKYCDIYGLLSDFSESCFELLFERALEDDMQKELIYCLDSVDAFFGTGYCPSHTFGEELRTVIDPAAKKFYRYADIGPVERFFAADRAGLLSEVSK